MSSLKPVTSKENEVGSVAIASELVPAEAAVAVLIPTKPRTTLVISPKHASVRHSGRRRLERCPTMRNLTIWPHRRSMRSQSSPSSDHQVHWAIAHHPQCSAAPPNVGLSRPRVEISQLTAVRVHIAIFE